MLSGLSERELPDVGECPYDQGGYFIVNGGEKVLIAQEKMCQNHVFIFAKSQPSKYSYVAECRSCLDSGSRPTSTLFIKMLHRTGGKVNNTLPILLKFLNFKLGKLHSSYNPLYSSRYPNYRCL
jgi:DNA-directed RNA polymerase II subunit RPB2